MSWHGHLVFHRPWTTICAARTMPWSLKGQGADFFCKGASCRVSEKEAAFWKRESSVGSSKRDVHWHIVPKIAQCTKPCRIDHLISGSPMYIKCTNFFLHVINQVSRLNVSHYCSLISLIICTMICLFYIPITSSSY